MDDKKKQMSGSVEMSTITLSCDAKAVRWPAASLLFSGNRPGNACLINQNLDLMVPPKEAGVVPIGLQNNGSRKAQKAQNEKNNS